MTTNPSGDQMHSALEEFAHVPPVQYFDVIRRIPRGSKNEAQICQYLEDWAKQHNFRTVKDEFGNITISVPATSGYEKVHPITLQVHADMVINDDEPKDEPVDVEVARDKNGVPWLQSKGNSRTLGADNGAGLAMCMSAITDPELPHGPLNLSVTVQEEIGLLGAENYFTDEHGTKDSWLINVDTPQENTLALECAGWAYVLGRLPIERQAELNMAEYQYVTISIDGFEGGHSGDDVTKNRGNATMVLGKDVLASLPQGAKLVSFSGGDANNGLPSKASMCVAIPKQGLDMSILQATVTNSFAQAISGLKAPRATIDIDASTPQATVHAMTDATHGSIRELLQTMPDGVRRMTDFDPTLPAVSSTLTIAETTKDQRELFLRNLLRGSPSAKEELQQAIDEMARLMEEGGFAVEQQSGEGWRQELDSPLLQAAIAVCTSEYGTAPAQKGYHSTPEIGEFMSRGFAGGVSLGPTVLDEHAKTERLDLHSFERMYRVLQNLVRYIAEHNVRPESVIDAPSAPQS